MSNKNLHPTDNIRIGLYRKNKLVKVFPSQANCARYYKLNDSTIHHNLISNHFSFLKDDEILKKISDTTSIKFEIKNFKVFISYLKKNKRLNFLCNKCLIYNKERLPIKTFQTVGLCERCNQIQEVSSGALNKWLLNRKYNLQISDRSKFLKEFMPFDLVVTSIPVEEKILKIEEVQNLVENEKNPNVKRYVIPNCNEIFVRDFKEYENIGNPYVEELNKTYLKKPILKLTIPDVIFWNGLVVIITLSLFSFLFWIGSYELEQNNIMHQVKAIIVEKNGIDNYMVYKNTEQNIFKIPNALRFWDCGEKGDSITVSFKNMNNPIFIDVKPILKK